MSPEKTSPVKLQSAVVSMVPDHDVEDLLTAAFLSKDGGNRALARITAKEAVRMLRKHRIAFFRDPPPLGSEEARLEGAHAKRFSRSDWL